MWVVLFFGQDVIYLFIYLFLYSYIYIYIHVFGGYSEISWSFFFFICSIIWETSLLEKERDGCTDE